VILNIFSSQQKGSIVFHQSKMIQPKIHIKFNKMTHAFKHLELIFDEKTRLIPPNNQLQNIIDTRIV